MDRPEVAGAFLTGSVTALAPDAELPATSDVDVVVVLRNGPAVPAKPGKLRCDGVLLEVTELPWSEVADPAVVARTHYLAPSFAGDHVLADPTGHLARLRTEIAPSFAAPEAVQARCEDVLIRMVTRSAALDPAAPWHEQVLTWLFPATLPTQVPLVAALRPPTVRRRFVAAREVLAEHGQLELYGSLVDLVDAGGRDGSAVQHHLDQLEPVLDQVASVARTPFPFSADLTPDARPVTVQGSRELVAAGDHREAVFWVVATWGRCLTVLTTDAPSLVVSRAAQRFREVTADLLGVSTPAALAARRDAALALVPAVRAAGERIIDVRQVRAQARPEVGRSG